MRAHDEQFRQFVADRSAELLRLADLLCGEGGRTAELLGCSAETVRSQTKRGLAKLRSGYGSRLTTGDHHE
jgi:DNA-directed RNA polymerase specialized sigma24 family protein